LLSGQRLDFDVVQGAHGRRLAPSRDLRHATRPAERPVAGTLLLSPGETPRNHARARVAGRRRAAVATNAHHDTRTVRSRTPRRPWGRPFTGTPPDRSGVEQDIRPSSTGSNGA